MKKLTLSLIVSMMVMAFMPSFVKAEAVRVNVPTTTTVSVVPAKTAESAETKALVSRLETIQAMDFSTLTKTEKRALRSEVRSIKATLKETDGGVIYISAGALLVIVLIIIILL